VTFGKRCLECASVAEKQWIREELPETAPEEVIPTAQAEAFKKWMTPRIEDVAGARWDADVEIQPCIKRREFQ
jgi:hypothetical protein